MQPFLRLVGLFESFTHVLVGLSILGYWGERFGARDDVFSY